MIGKAEERKGERISIYALAGRKKTIVWIGFTPPREELDGSVHANTTPEVDAGNSLVIGADTTEKGWQLSFLGFLKVGS